MKILCQVMRISWHNLFFKILPRHGHAQKLIAIDDATL